MPEKGANSPTSKLPPLPSLFVPSPLHQWPFRFFTALAFLALLIVLNIDGFTVRSFMESWGFKQELYQSMNPQPTEGNPGRDSTAAPPRDQTAVFAAAPAPAPAPAPQTSEQPIGLAEWATAELEPNFTSSLLAQLLAPGGDPCGANRTEEVAIPDLDDKGVLELTAGEGHVFVFQAVDESRNPRCTGGDYFESDLSGESWKSRPPVKDFGNGNYSITLQVHPDFAGDYDLTLILLYRHFEGLKYIPTRSAVTKKLRNLRIKFVTTSNNNAHQLPQLKTCGKSDFTKDLWVGRWTRQGKNDSCQISNDGRFLCLPPDFPCREPWCNGSLGSLESNGWVYSGHCSFQLFQPNSAWSCLKNRWIFFSGDSNHVDTIRNLLNFVLNVTDVKSVPRRFDSNFTNPNDASQSVRITSIFNGHWNETENHLGLDSFRNQGFRDLLKGYFTGDTVPDTVILNSGLHDGTHWRNIQKFVTAVDDAAEFWKEVLASVAARRGLTVPRVVYRTTVATAGSARVLPYNPSKMEVFNWVVLDKFRRAGVIDEVVDDFDMTFPWHYDNRCSDGIHYGRPPLKAKWKDGRIGHQYFVDLMLCHVLLNVLCAR